MAGRRHGFGQTSLKRECVEIELFLTALEIAQTGQINLLMICEKCEKRLLARVKGQKFCSENCRIEFHSFNEADKKRRAAWARRNTDRADHCKLDQ